MAEVMLTTEVDEFRLGKIKSLIDAGTFRNEQEFLHSAIDEMIKRTKIQKLNKEMNKFASQMTKRYTKNLGDTVIESRKEEDDRL